MSIHFRVLLVSNIIMLAPTRSSRHRCRKERAWETSNRHLSHYISRALVNIVHVQYIRNSNAAALTLLQSLLVHLYESVRVSDLYRHVRPSRIMKQLDHLDMQGQVLI